MTGILDPWLGTLVAGSTIVFMEPLTDLGCSGGTESWQHIVSLPAASIPRVSLDFIVQHVLLINNGSGPVSWYGATNAVEFSLVADSVPIAAWGVPPAHHYSNDGRSMGSAIRIPLLAYRHINDGDVSRVRFTLTHPDNTQTTQNVTSRTTDTPTASTSGSPFLRRVSGQPTDQQSKLSAFFFTESAASLMDGFFQLKAEVMNAAGTTVLGTVEDMSFWNNWGGTAISYEDAFVDASATSHGNGQSAGAPAPHVQGALEGHVGGASVVSVKHSNYSATFFRIRLRGTAKQSWGGRVGWNAQQFGNDPHTWIEVVGEGSAPDGNVLVEEPFNHATLNGSVNLGHGGISWAHFKDVVVDDDWSLGYVDMTMTDTRGWYDGVTMGPGIYANPANPPHVMIATFRQGLGGFLLNYATDVSYQNPMDVDAFNVGSDIIVQGTLLQSGARFADSNESHVHWGVEVPKQTAARGEVAGTFEPFNSWDWPWNVSPYTGITVTATALPQPNPTYLRVSIPNNVAMAAQFLQAAQDLNGLPDVGFKIRHANSLYTQRDTGATTNDGDWSVVGYGSSGGNYYVDLTHATLTPADETSAFINLKATYRRDGTWDPNGFDPHPDILEVYMDGRGAASPPLIVQGFRAFDVRNAQLMFTHGNDLVNTAFVNCAIGCDASIRYINTLTDPPKPLRMRNFLFRNCYVPGSWNLQSLTGEGDYADVEVTKGIFDRIGNPSDVEPTSPDLTGHWLFQSNRFETGTFLGIFGEMNPGSYSFGWTQTNPATRASSGVFTNTSSVTGLGPWGFALDGGITGS
jgi:hypothetical protein